MEIQPLIAWAACLIFPALWGWLAYRLLQPMLRHAAPPKESPKQNGDQATLWDYQI